MRACMPCMARLLVGGAGAGFSGLSANLIG
jgi:hypothetical protein